MSTTTFKLQAASTESEQTNTTYNIHTTYIQHTYNKLILGKWNPKKLHTQPTQKRHDTPPPRHTLLVTQRSVGELDALDPGRDLLEGYETGLVRSRVLGLVVNAERTEATVVGGAETLDRYVLSCFEKRVPHLLRRLHARIERVDHSDEADLSRVSADDWAGWLAGLGWTKRTCATPLASARECLPQSS